MFRFELFFVTFVLLAVAAKAQMVGETCTDTCHEPIKCCLKDDGSKMCSECCQDADCPPGIGMICVDNMCTWESGIPGPQ